jgi:hypothetical protein
MFIRWVIIYLILWLSCYKFLETFNSLCVNTVIHFKYFLQMQTPLAMWCKQLELYPKFLHDLHNGQASTKE